MATRAWSSAASAPASRKPERTPAASDRAVQGNPRFFGAVARRLKPLLFVEYSSSRTLSFRTREEPVFGGHCPSVGFQADEVFSRQTNPKPNSIAPLTIAHLRAPAARRGTAETAAPATSPMPIPRDSAYTAIALQTASDPANARASAACAESNLPIPCCTLRHS